MSSAFCWAFSPAETLNLGPFGAFFTPAQERLDLYLWALNMHLDCAIIEVHHPASEAKLTRPRRGRCPIGDPLNAPLDTDTHAQTLSTHASG